MSVPWHPLRKSSKRTTTGSTEVALMDKICKDQQKQGCSFGGGKDSKEFHDVFFFLLNSIPISEVENKVDLAGSWWHFSPRQLKEVCSPPVRISGNWQILSLPWFSSAESRLFTLQKPIPPWQGVLTREAIGLATGDIRTETNLWLSSREMFELYLPCRNWAAVVVLILCFDAHVCA